VWWRFEGVGEGGEDSGALPEARDEDYGWFGHGLVMFGRAVDLGGLDPYLFMHICDLLERGGIPLPFIVKR